jgi:hypothetical protein
MYEQKGLIHLTPAGECRFLFINTSIYDACSKLSAAAYSTSADKLYFVP